jgi:hypothetical protein
VGFHEATDVTAATADELVEPFPEELGDKLSLHNTPKRPNGFDDQLRSPPVGLVCGEADGEVLLQFKRTP